jgi:hypothetical protein
MALSLNIHRRATQQQLNRKELQERDLRLSVQKSWILLVRLVAGSNCHLCKSLTNQGKSYTIVTMSTMANENWKSNPVGTHLKINRPSD